MSLHCAASKPKFLNVYFFFFKHCGLSWPYAWESNIFFVFSCLLSGTLVLTSFRVLMFGLMPSAYFLLSWVSFALFIFKFVSLLASDGRDSAHKGVLTAIFQCSNIELLLW